MVDRRLNGASSSLSSRTPILEKSRMSLMIVSSDSAEDLATERYSCCSGVRRVSSVRSIMPMVPCTGVRISWLMRVRNSVLARLASSAAAIDFLSIFSVCLRLVMSRAIPVQKVPSGVFHEDRESSRGNSVPSFLSPTTSMVCPTASAPVPRAILVSTLFRECRYFTGSSDTSGRPITSFAE